MRETRDDLWCFLVARRAVARACLHLGIASASQEALDTLAELLLAYAERVAAAVSTSAEAGRRSTANVFDALHAVPLCTTPAVQRVYHTHGGGGGAGGLPAASPADRSAEEAGDGGGGVSPQPPSSPALHLRQLHAADPAHDLSWKGLAAFMFGPGWEQPLSPEELEDQDGGYLRRERGPGGGPGGGKVGPSSVLADGGFAGGSSLADGEAAASGAAASGNGHGISESSRGWCAPYPDRLPRFPVSRRRAPPSRGALADDDESGGGGEDEDGERGETAGAMPENPFSPSWTALPQAAGGGVGAAPAAAAGSKRRRDGDGADEEGNEEAEEGPARKRVRISEADASVAAAADGSGQATGDDNADGSDGPTLLPRFLPPFPPRRRDSAPRPVLEAPAAPAPAGPGGAATGTGGKGPPPAAGPDEGGLAVRSALVSLPGSHWGGPGNAAMAAAPLLSVPWGRPEAAGDVGGPGTAAAAGAPAQIVPLGRASGSRVSRILEGSMDGP
jgi:histone H3/H4